ncbi:TIGR00725 family protein, partial [Chloroflexota bacterium]
NMGYARNAVIIQSSQGVIAVDGGYGTLSEIALALASGIPVVGIGTWSLSIGGVEDRSVLRAATAADAVGMLLAKIEEGSH